MKKGLVSIIIPAYNVEKYIGSVIEDIQKQTYTNWELIIVDDGSTDHTYDIIEKYAKLNNKIIIQKRVREPKGSTTCRNIGQELARGEYFIHFDSDDIIEPFCLQQRVKFMNSRPDIDFAIFRGQSVHQLPNGKVVQSGRSWGVNPHKDVISCFLSTQYPFSVWNCIYRNSSFIDYLWDEQVKIYTDFSYIVPSLVMGKKYAFDEMSKPDYLYRQGQSNAMTTKFISDDRYRSTKYLFTKTINELKTAGVLKKYKRKFGRFFSLQYQRVLLDGSEEQIKDFFNYYLSMYPEMFIRINVSYNILKGKKTTLNHVAYHKLVMAVTSFMFSPENYFLWVKSKVIRAVGK